MLAKCESSLRFTEDMLRPAEDQASVSAKETDQRANRPAENVSAPQHAAGVPCAPDRPAGRAVEVA
jgi:hypothetical protein